MTSPDPLRRAREETIRTYFRRVDARDPALLDLFTEDVAFFFPKFGMAQGKAAVAKFGRRLQGFLARLEHDIDGLRIIVDGDVAMAEGREWGMMRDGTAWPDGVISQGRFCDVFEFEGPLIRRAYIYVDPDFTNADGERLRLLRGEKAVASTRAVAERYFERVLGGAEPEELAALFSEDTDWDVPGAVDRVPWIGPRKGRSGVVAFFRDLARFVEPVRFDVHRIAAEGDRALAWGDLAGRVRRTGALFESEFAISLTVRDGLIVRYRLLEDSFALARAIDENPA